MVQAAWGWTHCLYNQEPGKSWALGSGACAGPGRCGLVWESSFCASFVHSYSVTDFFFLNNSFIDITIHMQLSVQFKSVQFKSVQLSGFL